jgi:hypothetical protein
MILINKLLKSAYKIIAEILSAKNLYKQRKFCYWRTEVELSQK